MHRTGRREARARGGGARGRPPGGRGGPARVAARGCKRLSRRRVGRGLAGGSMRDRWLDHAARPLVYVQEPHEGPARPPEGHAQHRRERHGHRGQRTDGVGHDRGVHVGEGRGRGHEHPHGREGGGVEPVVERERRDKPASRISQDRIPSMFLPASAVRCVPCKPPRSRRHRRSPIAHAAWRSFVSQVTPVRLRSSNPPQGQSR